MSWTGIVRYRVTTILIAAFAAQIIACGEEDGGTTAGGGTQQDASADATVDARADATEVGNDADEGGVTSCAPKTCAQFGANCGSAPDGCGEVIECGVCAAGQTCGGAGTNKCGTDTCAPKSCVQVGAECGWAPDGCAEAIDCGACMAPDTCGGAGVDNQCGCSCTRDHAQTQCLAGVCSIDVCDSGWDDCDGDVDNGCEKNTSADVANCGACGQACSTNRVPSPACSGSVCSGACQNGYADCNSNKLTDGCETNTGSDSNNCGACGHVCSSGQPCVGGTCHDPCSTNTCNAHGWCNPSGSCECDPGYAGSSCTSCTDGWMGSSGSCYPTNQLTGTNAADSISGTSGNDYIRGLDGNDTLRGMDGSDYVNGNGGDDPLVNGNVGNDEVRGGTGHDSVYGGSGNDAVFGDDGNDHLYGDSGNDRLTGGDGNDTLEGGDGDDRYMIDGLGDDIINDSTGYDEARCLPGIKVGTDVMVGADRRLTLTNGRTVLILGNRVESILGCN